MSRVVTNLQEAQALLDYFNGFHDGFIKTLSILSHDTFEGRGVQTSSRRLDLEITFAHYNYQQGEKPASQHVAARFYAVMDFSMAFSGLLYEWSIDELFISASSRTLEDARRESCLAVVLVQSRLDSQRVWQRHEGLKFTFDHAEFAESAPPNPRCSRPSASASGG